MKSVSVLHLGVTVFFRVGSCRVVSPYICFFFFFFLLTKLRMEGLCAWLRSAMIGSAGLKGGV